MPKKHSGFGLMKDALIIVASIFFAVILVRTHVLANILLQTKEMEYFGSFVAGLFFTSVFTTAPAIVTLGQIAEANNIWMTALFGAFGALIGDLLIFRFVRDELTEHLLAAMKHSPGLKRFKTLMRGKHFRWFTIALGGIIIASPLPDELGISLIGLSKSSTKYFIPMSLIFNFIGILLIGLAAKAIPG
jgi:hypothetical protein